LGSWLQNQHHVWENGFHFFHRISWDAYNEKVKISLLRQKKYKEDMVATQSGSALNRIYNHREIDTSCHEQRNPASQASLWGAPKNPEAECCRKAANLMLISARRNE